MAVPLYIKHGEEDFFIRISQHREVGWKNEARPNFLSDIEIPIPDEILLRVNKQKRKVRFHTCNKITGRMISENKISKVS